MVLREREEGIVLTWFCRATLHAAFFESQKSRQDCPAAPVLAQAVRALGPVVLRSEVNVKRANRERESEKERGTERERETER